MIITAQEILEAYGRGVRTIRARSLSLPAQRLGIGLILAGEIMNADPDTLFAQLTINNNVEVTVK